MAKAFVWITPEPAKGVLWSEAGSVVHQIPSVLRQGESRGGEGQLTLPSPLQTQSVPFKAQFPALILSSMQGLKISQGRYDENS